MSVYHTKGWWCYFKENSLPLVTFSLRTPRVTPEHNILICKAENLVPVFTLNFNLTTTLWGNLYWNIVTSPRSSGELCDWVGFEVDMSRVNWTLYELHHSLQLLGQVPQMGCLACSVVMYCLHFLPVFWKDRLLVCMNKEQLCHTSCHS